MNTDPPPGLFEALATVLFAMLAFALLAPVVWQAGQSPPVHDVLLEIVEYFDSSEGTALSML
jgi:hypothetical protein